MSYQKQNFANGEVLTASQLNHIENGITDVESAANTIKGVVDKIIDPTLSLSGKAADAAKVGEAVGQLKEDLDNFGVAKVNPNNILGNQSLLNSVELLPSEKNFYISGNSVVTLDDGIAKYIQLQSGEYIYCIIPLESIVSGSYIAKIKRIGASKYLGRFLFTFGIFQGNVFGQLGGGKMLDASDKADPEWEFELNIEKTKEDYPTATHIRFGFSNSSNSSAYFGYPFICAQANDDNFYVYNKLLNDYQGYSKLYKKSISIDGDSISRGVGNNNVGYAEIIGNMLNMTVYNQAVSGGTLATETKFSNGTNRHWISGSIKSMHDADYIIVSGGFNDYGNNVKIGELTFNLSGDYSQTCDTTTILGAIEQICRDLIATFPERKIGFVLTHKIGNTWRVANTEGHTMKQIHDAMIECLERYSIPYCDLFTKSQFPTEIVSLKQYTDNGSGVNDGVHPNQKGYELFYVPKIMSWLETL